MASNSRWQNLQGHHSKGLKSHKNQINIF